MARRSASISALGVVAALLAACGSPVTPSAAPSAAPSIPIALDITLEAGSAAAASIGAAGGTITAASAAGVTYEFVVPPLALLSATEITMTPVSAIGGLPLSGGFVAGVDFAPSGLVLAEPGTLTITANRQPAGDQRLVGFSYEDTPGSFNLAAAKASAGAITIPVGHFSAAGAGFGTTQDIESMYMTNPTAPGTSQIAIGVLAEAFFSEPRDGAYELGVMERWFDFIVLPEINAVTTDAQLVGAASTYRMWDYFAPDALGIYEVIPGGRDAPSLVSRRTAWLEAYVAKVRPAIDGNLQLCAAPGIASARLAALDNALFWSRMARIVHGVATEANGLDLASFQASVCAQGMTQQLTLADPLSSGVAANLDATFALRFTDGQVVPANFVVRATGQGATLQFPQFTAATPPGFSTGLVTPTGGAVTIDLAVCYAGGGILGFIAFADEICHAEHVVREVGHGCTSDPMTISSLGDDPDKIYVVFDGASTCRLVAEIGDDHFPGNGADVVISIDTDPDETTWDAEDSDDDDDGLSWQEVGGFGQNIASGASRTIRSRHVATGQVFEITLTVRVELVSGGPDTRMTVENVSIVAVD
jgi:hypothetical protein